MKEIAERRGPVFVSEISRSMVPEKQVRYSSMFICHFFNFLSLEPILEYILKIEKLKILFY